MEDEMHALQQNGIWELVSLPAGKKTLGGQWVYTVKLNPNGTLTHLKARLVIRGYSQIYGVDYQNTFSPVAKMASVQLLISLAAINQ